MPFWDPRTPTVRSRISEIDDYIREMKLYLEDALGREHVFFGENKGKHIAGKFPVVHFTYKSSATYPPNTTHYLVHYLDTGETYYVDPQNRFLRVWSGDLFPKGTRTIFFQPTAPPGWVIVSGIDDAVVCLTRGDIPTMKGGTFRGSWTITGFPPLTHTHTYTIPQHRHLSPFGYNTSSGDLFVYHHFGSGDPTFVNLGTSLRTGVEKRSLLRGTYYDVYSGYANLAYTSYIHQSTSLISYPVTVTISHNGNWRPPGVWGIICEKQ